MNKKLTHYLELIEQRPDLFDNPEETGVIKIVTDPVRIRLEQARLRKQLREKGQPVEWAEIGVLVEDPWFLILRDIVQFPDGKVGRYIRVLNKKSSLQGGSNVVILAIQKNKVVLLRHFRHEGRQFYWETPRGFGEPGILADTMARTEIKEELNVIVTHLVKIGFEPEGMKGGTAYYYAELPGDARLIEETAEGIAELSLVPLSELDTWIEDGRLSDLLSMKVILLAKIKGLI